MASRSRKAIHCKSRDTRITLCGLLVHMPKRDLDQLSFANWGFVTCLLCHALAADIANGDYSDPRTENGVR